MKALVFMFSLFALGNVSYASPVQISEVQNDKIYNYISALQVSDKAKWDFRFNVFATNIEGATYEMENAELCLAQLETTTNSHMYLIKNMSLVVRGPIEQSENSMVEFTFYRLVLNQRKELVSVKCPIQTVQLDQTGTPNF